MWIVTHRKKRVKVDPGKSNIGKVEQRAAIVCSPLATDGDSELPVCTILEAVEGHLQEAAESAPTRLLKEGAKWVADSDRSPVKRELVQVWGIARNSIGPCLCTYVPPPPYIVWFIYSRPPSLQMWQKCSELEGNVGALRAQLEASKNRANEQAAEVTKVVVKCGACRRPIQA